jgi:hypothetical protein
MWNTNCRLDGLVEVWAEAIREGDCSVCLRGDTKRLPRGWQREGNGKGSDGGSKN